MDLIKPVLFLSAIVALIFGCGGSHKGHHMPHKFDDAEKWAKHFEGPERDAWQKPAHVVEKMEITPGMEVADIGAGTGYFLPHLSSAVGPEGAVHALDIEENLVTHMSQKAADQKLDNVHPRRIEPDNPALEEGSIDRILIVNTWHHIGERTEYAAKLKTALSEGGAIYIVDFELDSDKGPPRNHKLSKEAVVRELQEGGFETTIIEEDLEHQYIVVGR